MLSAIFYNGYFKMIKWFLKRLSTKNQGISYLMLPKYIRYQTDLNEKTIVAKEFQCFNWGHDIQICTFKNDNLTVQLF